jgi:hypothetical protein
MIALPTFRGALAGFNPLSLAPALWVNDTGSNPSVWTDISGNGRDAVQATGANQPSIVTGAINGRQVRRFDGTDDRLIPPDFSLDQHVVFYVATPNPALGAAASTMFSIGSTVSSARDTMAYFTNTAGAISVNMQRSDSTTYPTATTTTNLLSQIVTTKYTGTQLAVYVNNGTRGTITTTNSGSAQNKPCIGATREISSTTFLYPYKGDIAEIIVYPFSLSDANCLRVEKYLSNKYNIAIA